MKTRTDIRPRELVDAMQSALNAMGAFNRHMERGTMTLAHRDRLARALLRVEAAARKQRAGIGTMSVGAEYKLSGSDTLHVITAGALDDEIEGMIQ